MKPEIKTYSGIEAKQQFDEHLFLASRPEATGGVFGYEWAATPDGKTTAPRLVKLAEPTDAAAIPELDHRMLSVTYSMVVIDSGNSHGDSWKYIYWPALQLGTFTYESV
jgi:hypothetical protein